jgi:tetratricopeptide (TPR) repeat protein
MQEVGLGQVFQAIEQAFKDKEYPRVEALLWPAIDQFNDHPALWFYAANLFFARELSALAAACYERSLELEPNSVALANLGACYRRMNQHERAIEVLQRATEYDQDNPGTWTNLGACYVNEGDPRPGIVACERALQIKPGFPRAEWNLGLLHLEAGDFDNGFRLYRSGLGKERLLRYYHGPDIDTPGENEPELLDRRHLGKLTGRKVVVWGEQGLGDELMFANCLHELLAEGCQVVFEHHPRMTAIYQAAFGKYTSLTLIPTRKANTAAEAMKHGPFDYRCGVGDLACLFRRSADDYAEAWRDYGPFWPCADQGIRAEYRARLEELAAGRKIIGLATRGGVIKTMRSYRTIGIGDLAPLLKLSDRFLFVCFDYEDVGEAVLAVNQKHGESAMCWPRAAVQHFDYDHTHALVLATDRLVTVCQSIAHLAAGSGHPTDVLVPSKPAWRYGLQGSEWFLYPGPHARLHRQKGDSWEEAVHSTVEALCAGGK